MEQTPPQRTRLLERLRKFADRRWYAPVVGLLAGADQFIVIIPIETLMIPSVLLKPKSWLRTALWVATGCAVGALVLGTVTDLYGMTAIERWAPHVIHSPNWARSIRYINDHGAWSLFLISLSPIPQQPAVALAGLSHMSLIKIFLAVWTARAIKYCTLTFVASHAPRLLQKFLPSLIPNPKGDTRP